MKKLIIITLILLSLILSSCNEKEEEKLFAESNISVETYEKDLALLDILNETIIYSPKGENTLDKDYFDYYFANGDLFDKVSDYVYFTSATTSVCETGIFKVKDEETKKALLSAFEIRKENLISTYENYSPEDVETAKNMISGSFDDVVWFVITKDNQTVKEII